MITPHRHNMDRYHQQLPCQPVSNFPSHGASHDGVHKRLRHTLYCHKKKFARVQRLSFASVLVFVLPSVYSRADTPSFNVCALFDLPRSILLKERAAIHDQQFLMTARRCRRALGSSRGSRRGSKQSKVLDVSHSNG